MGVVYLAENLKNGKRYIGRTIKTIAQRRKEHESCVLRKQTRTPFLRALAKYGFENFSWTVLLRSNSNRTLNNSEKGFIKRYKSHVSKSSNQSLLLRKLAGHIEAKLIHLPYENGLATQ